ncbi:MAG: hypothetical protein HY550_00220 [Elusimicrobia bacterium]|nr:hypothetical protein [Elusimicrobiota bacterium]
MNIKKIAAGLLAALALSLASAAYAADNGTEFGIEDDLTVLGKAGTAVDPDVEIKGFTVFGSTQASYLIPVDTGNVVLNGAVQVSSGLYVTGGSTFATGAYFTGISSFSDVANLHMAGGTANQVLKKVAGGGLVWANDDTTAITFQTPYRLQMVNGAGNDFADSLFMQESAGLGITLISGSSFTVTGALGVAGDVAVNANKFTVTAANGNTLADGTLNVNGNAQLGNAGTDIHGINTAPVAGTALKVADDGTSGNYVATFYSGAALAAWIKKK